MDDKLVKNIISSMKKEIEINKQYGSSSSLSSISDLGSGSEDNEDNEDNEYDSDSKNSRTSSQLEDKSSIKSELQEIICEDQVENTYVEKYLDQEFDNNSLYHEEEDNEENVNLLENSIDKSREFNGVPVDNFKDNVKDKLKDIYDFLKIKFNIVFNFVKELSIDIFENIKSRQRSRTYTKISTNENI